MMKNFFLLLLILIISVTSIICQNNDKSQSKSQVISSDSVVVWAINGHVRCFYPLTSDRRIEELKRTIGEDSYSVIYPLLILNDVIIREEEKVNCFRNRFELVNIKRTKRISKEEAERKGILNVPKDGVLFVTTKKGYYFDFSCE